MPIASSAPVGHKLPIKRLLLSHKFKPLKTLFDLRMHHPRRPSQLSPQSRPTRTGLHSKFTKPPIKKQKFQPFFATIAFFTAFLPTPLPSSFFSTPSSSQLRSALGDYLKSFTFSLNSSATHSAPPPLRPSTSSAPLHLCTYQLPAPLHDHLSTSPPLHLRHLFQHPCSATHSAPPRPDCAATGGNPP